MTDETSKEFSATPLPRSIRSGLSRLKVMRQFRLCLERPWLEQKTVALQELFELASASYSSDDGIANTNLIVDLLYDFTYLGESEYWECLEEIVTKIKDDWQLKPDDTLIVGAEYTSEADSSQKIVYDIKSRFGGDASPNRWHNDNFVSSLTGIAEKLGNKSNLILLDDFNGTGTKLTRILERLHPELTQAGLNPRIRVCSIASMEASRGKVSDAIPLEDYFATKWLKKGISDRYSGEELDHAKECMLSLESHLKNGFRSFGWGSAEALYGTASNTPNSVFPIFWWDDLKTGKRKATILRKL